MTFALENVPHSNASDKDIQELIEKLRVFKETVDFFQVARHFVLTDTPVLRFACVVRDERTWHRPAARSGPPGGNRLS